MEKLKLGQLLATPGAIEVAERTGDDLTTFLSRHAAGDQGFVDRED